MPELPEVEIFKRYRDATSLHQRIDDVDVRNAYVLKNVTKRELARRLKGHRFESSRRHGKHLFVRGDGELCFRQQPLSGVRRSAPVWPDRIAKGCRRISERARTGTGCA